MNLLQRLALLALAAGLALPLVAQTPAAPAAPGLKSIAIAKVKVGPAIAAAADDKKLSLDRMTQSMDGQLIDRLQNTRKFQVIARSDADALIEEAGATGRAFDFGNADYLLVVTIDDFQDIFETANFAALGQSAKRRTIRFSAVGKIYEAATNKLIESANFQEKVTDSEATTAAIRSDGEISDELLVQLTRGMSEQIALRVADVIYPAKIIAKTGSTVTINRGDGSDIAAGQLWEVFAVGEEMIDPDTGVSLGREELSVGKVRVTRVTPKFSQATISGEDLGIDKGAVVRRVTE